MTQRKNLTDLATVLADLRDGDFGDVLQVAEREHVRREVRRSLATVACEYLDRIHAAKAPQKATES